MIRLAKYLLRKNKKWTDEKISLAMNQSIEQIVELDYPIPVFIVYFTCWVDEKGSIQFRKDIYGHDKRMEEHLFN